MAYRPNPAGPKTIRSLYHWVWAGLVDLGAGIGGDQPTDPPTPVPPPEPGSHSHYLDNLVNVDIPVKLNRDSLNFDEPTGNWIPENRSRTHIQLAQPSDAVSSNGDIWVVADIAQGQRQGF